MYLIPYSKNLKIKKGRSHKNTESGIHFFNTRNETVPDSLANRSSQASQNETSKEQSLVFDENKNFGTIKRARLFISYIYLFEQQNIVAVISRCLLSNKMARNSENFLKNIHNKYCIFFYCIILIILQTN